MIFNKKPTYDWVVVGLGNPGMEYEKTRHNVGFMAVDKLADLYSARLNKHKMQSLFGECRIGKNRVLIVKPQTYMNNSGNAVAAICKFYKIPAEKLIVIFDDISLDVGKLRIRRKGSHGGHNGIKDIIALMGTDSIKRVKIGVGERQHKDYDLKDWVLGKFPAEQHSALNDALDNTAKAVTEIILKGTDSAMNLYNS